MHGLHGFSARAWASCERSSTPRKQQFFGRGRTQPLGSKREGRGGTQGDACASLTVWHGGCAHSYKISSPFDVPPPPRKSAMNRHTSRRCLAVRQQPRAARWTGHAYPLQDSCRAATGARTFCARPATRRTTFSWRVRRAGAPLALLAAASYRSTVVDDPEQQRAICAPIARFLSQLRALLLRRRVVPEKRLETKLSSM